MHQIQGMQANKQGQYLTRDDNLVYYDELVHCLMNLKEQGVASVPILGYCYDPDSENGDGYIIQQRAKGEELYNDAILKEYYVGKENYSYLSNHTGVNSIFSTVRITFPACLKNTLING